MIINLSFPVVLLGQVPTRQPLDAHGPQAGEHTLLQLGLRRDGRRQVEEGSLLLLLLLLLLL